MNKKINFITFCNVYKIEFKVKVYNLCKTNKKIHEQRKAGHAEQEKATEKMLQVLPKYKYKFEMDNKFNS